MHYHEILTGTSPVSMSSVNVRNRDSSYQDEEKKS